MIIIKNKMKKILIFLFFGLTFSYNPSNAVNYAKKYCNNYNPNYNNYKGTEKEETANFVSQCISVGGGQDFTGCEGLDDKGMFTKVSDLKNCLILKGWKNRGSIIKRGFPAFLKTGYHVFLLTELDIVGPRYCSHDPDRCAALAKIRSLEIYTP